MSTRAQIAIQTGPEQWSHVYIHYDGSPSRMLPLLAHWKRLRVDGMMDLAREMMAGNMEKAA